MTRRLFHRSVAVAIVGLPALGGCDPNPGGPSYTPEPVAEIEGDSSQEQGDAKGKKKRGGPVGVIGDPAK